MVDTPKIELNLSGTWTDITSYVRYEDGISIQRGQQNEGSSTLDASTCSLTLDNRDGRFSPRKPTGAYYGQIGRNTPIRVSLPYGSTYLLVRPSQAARATCPDASALGITGDIDLRIDVDADQWETGDLAGKYVTTSNQRSWWLGVDTGRPQLVWSPDGTFTNRKIATATDRLPVARGRLAVRATLDVNNGAGGYTATFYTADTISGTWTQLGDAVTVSGTTSIFDSTAGIEIGDVSGISINSSNSTAIPGRYLAFQLRSGIAGTVVANPDFSTQSAGDTSFADTASSPNTWTVASPAALDDRLYRFWGEVSEWPPKRDISGTDATVSIQASGISRRLKQGNATLRSSMFREFANPARTSIVAYWPMEDSAEATQIAASDSTVAPARIIGSPKLADYSDWTATDPVPTMSTGRIVGAVPSYAATGAISVRMFVFMPSGGVSAETSLLHLQTSGTVTAWEVRLNAAGNLITKAWDNTGAPVDDGAGNLDSEITFDLDSLGFCILDLELSQNGSDIDWATKILDFTNTDTINTTIPGTSTSGTVTSETLGAARAVTVGRDQGLTDVVVGHLTVATSLTAYAATSQAIAAHNGENPLNRMIRLCSEEEIDFTWITRGQSDNPVTLGDQLDKGLVDLLQEAADADGGILYEPRDFLGFTYRTRLSQYNQQPTITLSCADHQLSDALVAVDDDQRTVNDITVKRVAGSQYRLQQTTGALTVDDPPDGVGRYDTSVDLSLERDDQLQDQAGWRLHLGTVDEARFPSISVNLAHSAFDAALTAQALAVDVGDRLVVTDPSDDLPPDDISQIVLGYSEKLDQFQHVITYVCAPESPYRVGVAADGSGTDFQFSRVDTGGSTLASSATSTATSLSVATTDALWTTDTGDLPFDVMVAGERVTVTAISGSSSPQTFTVTRSVNGVVKAQSSGAEVSIVDPVYVAL